MALSLAQHKPDAVPIILPPHPELPGDLLDETSAIIKRVFPVDDEDGALLRAQLTSMNGYDSPSGDYRYDTAYVAKRVKEYAILSGTFPIAANAKEKDIGNKVQYAMRRIDKDAIAAGLPDRYSRSARWAALEKRVHAERLAARSQIEVIETPVETADDNDVEAGMDG